MFVLHYDAADFNAWSLKWHRRIYGNTTAAAIHDKRRMQQDMYREATEAGEDAVRALFESLYLFPEDSIPAFEQAGLVVALENPVLDEVKRDLGIA